MFVCYLPVFKSTTFNRSVAPDSSEVGPPMYIKITTGQHNLPANGTFFRVQAPFTKNRRQKRFNVAIWVTSIAAIPAPATPRRSYIQFATGPARRLPSAIVKLIFPCAA
ncbi:hypothetical protein KCP76_11935 [Salmonella enterica subsp. enterica serovar Weltevreden]|nr:hypothetical protein KCP76_11935 [Salmonella enterica subsp. enterica serovar Weltevreden]